MKGFEGQRQMRHVQYDRINLALVTIAARVPYLTCKCAWQDFLVRSHTIYTYNIHVGSAYIIYWRARSDVLRQSGNLRG